MADNSQDLAKPGKTAGLGIIDWVRSHKVTASLTGAFVFSLGGPLNFFGNDPRIFYFPAVVLCALLCWIIMSGTHRFVSHKLNPSTTTAPQSLVESAKSTEKRIEGTDVSHEQLTDLFPFGYAVIYITENKRIRYEVFKNGLMDWKLDWDRLKVEPDIVSGNVTWTVCDLEGTSPDSSLAIHVGKMTVVRPLQKNGQIYPMAIIFERKPVPYVMTLSDNQRTPIFAIGFRIPAPMGRQKEKSNP
jgi:hypothetical protein